MTATDFATRSARETPPNEPQRPAEADPDRPEAAAPAPGEAASLDWLLLF